MASIKQLEIKRKTAPLGVRFWDPVSNRPIKSGLYVQIREKDTLGSWLTAQTTAGGIYALHHLPGWRFFEESSEKFDKVTSITTTKPYVVKVTDLTQTFRNFSFQLSAPFAGIFPSALTDISMPETPGIDLFSSATRSIPSGFSAVYVTCAKMIDNKILPASFALIKVTTEENKSYYGLADKEGRAIVMIAMPLIRQKLTDSLPENERTHLGNYTWDATLSIQYDESAQQTFDDCDEPDLLSLLNQSDVVIQNSISPVDEQTVLPIKIRYNQPVVVRTETYAELFIKP